MTPTSLPPARPGLLHAAIAIALAAACGLATVGAAFQPDPPATRPADHVIVISIDGFRPAMYLDPAAEGIRIPNLMALRYGGSVADGVEVSYPSLTYTSHTSLATGVRPERHGIVSNTRFDPPNGSSAWFFERSAMRLGIDTFGATRKHRDAFTRERRRQLSRKLARRLGGLTRADDRDRRPTR